MASPDHFLPQANLMGAAADCPPADKLALMSAGDLPSAEFEAVCSHVESCPACLELIDSQVPADNPFEKSWAGITNTDLDTASREIDSQPPPPPCPEESVAGSDSRHVLQPPCTLGPYEVEAVIGRGGMGEVYRARHTRLDRPVALKVIRHRRQTDPASHDRFLREMAHTGRLDHPNLIRAHDAWEAEGCLYLVMELIQGKPLSAVLAPGNALTVADVATIFRGACLGLEHLHARGILHGDLKPSNVMIQSDGAVKLIDIGLARPISHEQTGPAGGFGTRGWMSPEQEARACAIDHRADIWSLGRLLGHMLDRVSPTDADQKQRNLRARLREMASRMSAHAPSARPRNIGEVLAELNAACSGKPGRTGRALLALGAVALAVLAVWMLVPPVKRPLATPAGVGMATASRVAGSSLSMRMVTIPAGEFSMGGVENDPDAAADEWPVRRVNFPRPFAMGATEVTVAQFREFVKATGYTTDAEDAGKGGWRAGLATSKGEYSSEATWHFPGYPLAEDLPVTTVTYRDATEYCLWLSKRDGKRYRLPTEAEWEYACRAGDTTIFPYPEDERDEHCWSSYNCGAWLTPRPVGTRRANAWGLHDMMGNVREWCLDWYDARAYDTPYLQAPSGPQSGQLRTIRGACFMDKARLMRSATRGYREPDEAFNNQGFRVVQVDE